jgi:hypothetical protein
VPGHTSRSATTRPEVKKLILIGLVFAALYFGAREAGFVPRDQVASTSAIAYGAHSALATAYQNQQSNVQVQGSGRVTKVLADDNDGSRHQRFLVRLASGQTLLIAHNIDLASRVASIEEDDSVEFYGEYEWNPKGGVVHWTHRDPERRHVDGWIKLNGRTYQ